MVKYTGWVRGSARHNLTDLLLAMAGEDLALSLHSTEEGWLLKKETVIFTVEGRNADALRFLSNVLMLQIQGIAKVSV